MKAKEFYSSIYRLFNDVTPLSKAAVCCATVPVAKTVPTKRKECCFSPVKNSTLKTKALKYGNPVGDTIAGKHT